MRSMPNIASIFKAEIARVARKESRDDLSVLKKASSRYRSEIAALKRQLEALEKLVKKLARSTAASADKAAEPPKGEEAIPRRFSAKGLAAHRQRLGLSAADLGKLVGASALSVYKWESGSTRPRARYIEAIARVRDMSPNEAQERLGQVGSNTTKKAASKSTPALRKAVKRAAKTNQGSSRARAA